jgi:hypothetical protein
MRWRRKTARCAGFRGAALAGNMIVGHDDLLALPG